MKRLLLGLVSVALLALGMSFTIDNAENNVGDGEEYIYEVTEIRGNEIRGKALNKISDDNMGIFLYKNEDEIEFDVEIGSKIGVVWGEYEDMFVSIVEK